jgi:Zn-dependent protease
MEQNIRLGRIAGVPVGINWSILVIFWLLAWELADLVLPGYHPHQSTATYWIAGILVTVLFFASLLAHEVSHAVVAKRSGIGVRRITLWLFGGVSELESEALTPGADFRIAVVGPLTSFALAGLFGVLVYLLPKTGGHEEVLVSALGWLAWINLLCVLPPWRHAPVRHSDTPSWSSESLSSLPSASSDCGTSSWDGSS